MALNDAHPFRDGLLRFDGSHDFSGDTIKCALVTSSFTPTETTAHPCWGAGGTTDVSAYEVTAGGNYVAGGATCANPSTSLVGSDRQLDFDNPAPWEQDGSNPTNARWAIFYNDSAPNKECLGWYDLGAVHDMSGGETSITVGAPFATVS